MPVPVVVIIITKDEAVGIRTTLQALRDFAQVVVVDSESTDGTQEIARECGADVVEFVWNGAYPKKKQWSLENVSSPHEWVLLVDADERPTPELVDELRAKFADGSIEDHDAYDIELLYRFAGRPLRHGHKVVKRSLLRRGQVEFPQIDDTDLPGIGPVEGHYQPRALGSVGHLEGRLFHDDLDPVSSWFERHNRYSDWEAHLRRDPRLRRDVAAARTVQGRIFDRAPLKPLAFFAYSYILRRGFLDGRAGFDYCLALSFYYWQIGLKERELRRADRSAPSAHRERSGSPGR